MIDLLKQELETMLKTINIIESHEKSLPHPERVSNMIGFLNTLQESVGEQVKFLEKELKKFDENEAN